MASKTRTMPAGRSVSVGHGQAAVAAAPRIDPLQVFTVQQAAAALQVHSRTLRDLIRGGLIRPTSVAGSGSQRILGEDLLAYLRSRRGEGGLAAGGHAAGGSSGSNSV